MTRTLLLRDGLLCRNDGHPLAEPRHDPAEVRRQVAALRAVIAAEAAPPPDLAGDVVLTVSLGERYWLMIRVLHRTLRESGCRLPLQIWHDGCPRRAFELRDPLTTLVDIRDWWRAFPAACRHGFAAKTFAIAHSRAARVLFLDADVTCPRDPAPLFALLDEAPFCFWPDLPGNSITDWSLLGPPSRAPRQIQGGHYLLDCRAAWRALTVAAHYNDHGPEFWWDIYPWHDESAWCVALVCTKTPWLEIEDARWEHRSFTCAWRGQKYFVHRVACKLFADRQPAWSHALPGEARVEALYRELREQAGHPGHPLAGRGSGSEEQAAAPCPRRTARRPDWRQWRVRRGA
jgi:hypothetical protein